VKVEENKNKVSYTFINPLLNDNNILPKSKKSKNKKS